MHYFLLLQSWMQIFLIQWTLHCWTYYWLINVIWIRFWVFVYVHILFHDSNQSKTKKKCWFVTDTLNDFSSYLRKNDTGYKLFQLFSSQNSNIYSEQFSLMNTIKYSVTCCYLPLIHPDDGSVDIALSYLEICLYLASKIKCESWHLIFTEKNKSSISVSLNIFIHLMIQIVSHIFVTQ